MYVELWTNLREYLENLSISAIAINPSQQSPWDNDTPATRTFQTPYSTMYQDFDYSDASFSERSPAFKQVWEGIYAGAYQELRSTCYCYDEGDSGIAIVRQLLEPLKYFCEALVQQVGIRRDWMAALSCVNLFDQIGYHVGNSSYVCYVIELVPKDPIRPPVPENGLRIPLIGFVVSKEGACPDFMMKSESLLEMASYSHIFPSSDFNGLRAVTQTAMCAGECYLPQVWLADATSCYLFDYSECNLTPEYEGYRGNVTIRASNGLKPSMLMAQDCLDSIIRILPQWLVPEALWWADEYAPYPHPIYMAPYKAVRCPDCPSPILSSTRAWSFDSCKTCGGWGYVWYNEQEDNYELYWKPPTGSRWKLSWTSTTTPEVYESPELVGQTPDGQKPVISAGKHIFYV